MVSWHVIWILSSSNFEHKNGNFQKQDCNWQFSFKLFPGAAPISNFSQALPWVTHGAPSLPAAFILYLPVSSILRPPLVHSSWWCMWSNDGQSWMCEAKEWNALFEIWLRFDKHNVTSINLPFLPLLLLVGFACITFATLGSKLLLLECKFSWYNFSPLLQSFPLFAADQLSRFLSPFPTLYPSPISLSLSPLNCSLTNWSHSLSPNLSFIIPSSF